MDYGYKRFQAPVQGQQFGSEYDLASEMLIDLNQRGIAPLQVVTLNLASAGTVLLANPGRAFVAYFYQTGSAIKTQVTNGLVTCFINESNDSNSMVAFPTKHNRGFHGSFSQLFLKWGSQPGVSVDLVILRSKRIPWMTTGVNSSGGTSGAMESPVQTVDFTVADIFIFYPVDASLGNVSSTLPPGGPGLGSTLVTFIKVDNSANTVTIIGGLAGTVTLNFKGDAVSFYWSPGVNTWIAYA